MLAVPVLLNGQRQIQLLLLEHEPLCHQPVEQLCDAAWACLGALLLSEAVPDPFGGRSTFAREVKLSLEWAEVVKYRLGAGTLVDDPKIASFNAMDELALALPPSVSPRCPGVLKRF